MDLTLKGVNVRKCRLQSGRPVCHERCWLVFLPLEVRRRWLHRGNSLHTNCRTLQFHQQLCQRPPASFWVGGESKGSAALQVRVVFHDYVHKVNQRTVLDWTNTTCLVLVHFDDLCSETVGDFQFHINFKLLCSVYPISANKKVQMQNVVPYWTLLETAPDPKLSTPVPLFPKPRVSG